METAAREAWRRALEAWSIPQPLVDAVGVDRHHWEPEAWERSGGPTPVPPANPTIRRVAELSNGGSVLEIGSGGTAVALASSGHRVTVVTADPDEGRALEAAAALARAATTRIVGIWPVVAGNTGIHDVVMCTRSVYEVPGIGAFIEAMHRRARRGVVVEATPDHPWEPLWRHMRTLHRLARPRGPGIEDFLAVVTEVTGATPRAEHWVAPAGPRFNDLQELLSFYRRRLLVPPTRSQEAAALLEPEVRRAPDGRLLLGSPEREMVTVWWRK